MKNKCKNDNQHTDMTTIYLKNTIEKVHFSLQMNTNEITFKIGYTKVYFNPGNNRFGIAPYMKNM